MRVAPRPERRRALAGVAAAGGALAGMAMLSAGCSVLQPPLAADWPRQAAITDAATGQAISPAMLAERIAATPIVLLGERHDMAEHHRLRALLIDAWARRHPARPRAVVFEQLDREQQPALRRLQRGGEPDVGALLAAGGFDRAAWQWPLHAPLFDAAARADARWIAANFSRAAARRLMRPPGDGAPDVDPRLRAIVDAARWDDAAQAALESALRRGHCDQLPDAALPGIARVQRLRDAALAEPLLEANERRMILLAGNGHVRRDHGVPRYLGAFERTALVVGFLEHGDDDAGPDVYDVVVRVPPQARPDPCAAFAR